MKGPIVETYQLPSKAKFYKKEFDPYFTIRSMDTNDEELRLSIKDNNTYTIMSEIIDNCLESPKDIISSYDMLLGDYQYLLQRLRVATYGNIYRVEIQCPLKTCGHLYSHDCDLDILPKFEYDESMNDLLEITLPLSDDVVKLNLLTPRAIENIDRRAMEIKSKAKDFKGDPSFKLLLQSLIGELNGEKLSPAKLIAYVDRMKMHDANYLLKSYEKIKLGVDTICQTTCPKCGLVFNFDLPITGEFFGPSID